MQEEWKTVEITLAGENIVFSKYEVSNFGRVRKFNGFEPKPFVHKDGYIVFTLSDDDNKQRQCLGHRLVACTFIEHPPFVGAEVNHIDCDRANNRLDNLEWTTHLENRSHSVIFKVNNHDSMYMDGYRAALKLSEGLDLSEDELQEFSRGVEQAGRYMRSQSLKRVLKETKQRLQQPLEQPEVPLR